MTKILEINDCLECPQLGMLGDWCLHGDAPTNNSNRVKRGEPIPSWCPLPNKQEKGENDNGK
jgi:hypothetical protein